jgi:transcriptional regulator with XRE-family HTH domain
MIKSLIGERVRSMRTRAGYTQESFAKVCGLDRTYIAGVELGKRNISIENLYKIAEALNLTLAELCDVAVPPNRTILLNINGVYFILQSKADLTMDIKNHIEALCRCAYEDNSEFIQALKDNGREDEIHDLSPYDMAELFQKVVKDVVGIDVVFKGIDLEVTIDSNS